MYSEQWFEFLHQCRRRPLMKFVDRRSEGTGDRISHYLFADLIPCKYSNELLEYLIKSFNY